LLAARGRWTYAAIAILVPLLPYLLVHPTVRYRYLVGTLLLYLGVQAGAAGLAAVRAAVRR
jgi:hypothetical protein